MDEKDIIATLAAGYQRLDDRQAVIEDVFRDSIIIPGSKINALLITFAFAWVFLLSMIL